MSATTCPRSGDLVDADLTDGAGCLIPPCACGRVVLTDPGPTTSDRVIEPHRPLHPTELAGAQQ